MAEQLEQLLTCPFCGEAPVANNYYMNQGDKWGGIACGNCGVQGPEVRTGYAPWEHWKWKAIEQWNTRAPLTARKEKEGESD